MQELNSLWGLLGGIASLVTIIQFIREILKPHESPGDTAKSKRKKIRLASIFIFSISIVLFLPMYTLESEISQYGPYFFSVSESEHSKLGFILVKDVNKPIFVDDSFSSVSSKIKVLAKGGIWSQQNEKGYIRIVISNLQGCNPKSELMFSRNLPQDNPQNYRDSSRMETREDTIMLDCNPPVKELSLFADPGTWALSINSIKIIGVSKVNLLAYVNKHILS